MIIQIGRVKVEEQRHYKFHMEMNSDQLELRNVFTGINAPIHNGKNFITVPQSELLRVKRRLTEAGRIDRI